MAEQHYRTDTYRSADSVGYLVRRLYTLLVGRFERAMEHQDFTLTQWIVLIQLYEGRVRTASDIASDLSYDNGALTRVLDQLERRKLIVRQRSARDRRVVEIGLTAAGRRTTVGLLPVIVEQTNRALAPLDRAEFQLFRSFLVRILEHATGDPEAGPAEAASRRTRAVPRAGSSRPTARRSPSPRVRRTAR